MKNQFIVPLVTPFDADGQIDESSVNAVLEWQLLSGADGIVLLGSIGEFFALRPAQKAQLISLSAERTRGKTSLVVGIGGMDAQESIELAALARSAGADGVICVSPYYFHLPERDIEAYYDHIIRSCHLPFYLYNFPARTGHDLSVDLTRRLLTKHPSIIGFKDSVSGMEHTRRLLREVAPDFPALRVFSGFDENFIHNVLGGGSGCIAGLANIMPEVCAALACAANKGDFPALLRFQPILDDMMRIYSIAPLFIPVIKKAMSLRGLPITDRCSFPIQPVTEEQTEQIRALLRRNGLL